MKYKKWIRRIVFLLVSLAVLTVILYFVVQQHAKKKVIAVIQEIVDGPVEVDEVRLRRDRVEVRGIRVYESASDKTAWLTIDEALLGLTLAETIRGETIPETASIRGANVILDYDERRKLMTDFSVWQDGVEMRLKQIDVEDANVEIRQRGRDPLIARQIDGKILRTPQDIHIRATIGNALDARWNLDAHIQGDTFATTGNLTTDEVRFSTDELVKLPFFPEGAGQNVRASGVSPVELGLQLDEQRGLQFRVDLAPRSLQVEIPQAGLTVSNSMGNVVVQEDRMSFSELRGDVAGGRFAGSGDLSLQGETWSGQIQGTMDGIDLSRVPKQWQVPEQLRGTASGQLDLNVEISDSHFELRGAGNATIDEPTYAGISARPVKIGLVLDQLRREADAEEPTLLGTATVELHIASVDLDALLKAAEIDSSEFQELSGNLGFEADLQIPLSTATDPRSYRALGKLTGTDVRFRDVTLSDSATNFEFRDGVVTCRELTIQVGENGGLRGSIVAEVEPRGSITTDIEFESLPISLIESLGEEPTVSLDGFVSGALLASVPVDDWKNVNRWQLSGRVQSDEVLIDQLRFERVAAGFEMKNGVAAVRDLVAGLARTGKLQGSVVAAVEPRGNLTSDLTFESIPVSLIEKYIEQADISLDGLVSGRVRADLPIDDLKNPDRWQVSGRLQSPEILLDDHRFAEVDAGFELQQGRLALQRGSALWLGATVEVAGSLGVKQPFDYSLTLAARNLDVPTAAATADIELPLDVSGAANVNARLAGELQPFTWSAAGDARFSKLMIDKLNVNSPFAKWHVDPKTLKVTSAEATILGGTARFTAEFPFDSGSTSSVTGTFAELETELLEKHLPDVPLEVSGKAAGKFSLKGIENPRTASGTLTVRNFSGNLRGAGVEDVAIDLSLMRQVVDAKIIGNALGGVISLTGSASMHDFDRERLEMSARISAKGIQLPEVWQLSGTQAGVVPPEGVADIQLDVELAGPTLKPTGEGRLTIHDVRWRGRQVASQLTTNISVLDDSVVLRDVSFDYGGGRISGTLAFSLVELGSGQYSVLAENVGLRSLLFAFPKLARETNGTLDAGFRGRFASSRVEGSGRAQISSGQVKGVSLRGVDTVVNLAYDLSSRRGKADIRLTRGEISRGRTKGELSLKWGRQLTLDGKANFANVDLGSLGRTTRHVSDQLNGRISGSVSIQGRDVRSLEDLSGSYDLQIANSQLFRLPVLSDLTTATGIGSNSKTISDTEIKGRITRGVIHVDRMTMVAASIHMFIQGTVTTRGQLDLEVVADTGELLAVAVVAGIVRPQEWLRRRLIFLHVGGTIRSPVVLPQTEKFIQQEVMLFFLPFVVW